MYNVVSFFDQIKKESIQTLEEVSKGNEDIIKEISTKQYLLNIKDNNI